mmetsp:Transcript_6541/g.4910  ORF Transcript_6541/g.4910 Transcript_6541/m.4910 type:complete len:141 (-) Transcript_6541:50-472(-)|eukprot:CAMPEP_0202956952 /NCGR_PEP_ID=MMETSP1396-20130829/1406_1 /ASSEMBLY_ACC=CAM_ASM_000872 /TAXON_ID= /ORGANISM="Pseudokeronopsis sp., Strain Brazil" /LENGTH=140 /DNA_ID=CAMNT_0049674193 /DNA_START=233 /DNA_END=655 /DNA_ORIENTATION=-
MFPCRGVSATDQANSFYSQVNKNNFGTVWVDVEINPSSGCSWYSYSSSSNCSFLKELVNALKAYGKPVGIYSSVYQWEESMGSRYACTDVASGTPLWYASWNGQQSFSDWSAFGGWSSPAMKQYKGDTTLCGAGVDLNAY